MSWLPRKRGTKALACVLGLLITLGLTAYLFSQQLLCVDTGNVYADAIVVLGGGQGDRPARAAELFRTGAAPWVIISGAGDVEVNRGILVSAGVPEQSIQVEPNSKSTRQNAQFSIPLLHALGSKRVILVTSWYHSRRALNCFRHYAPDIQCYSRPAYNSYPRSEWSRQKMSRYLLAEYVKLVGYWVCYGVCPL